MGPLLFHIYIKYQLTVIHILPSGKKISKPHQPEREIIEEVVGSRWRAAARGGSVDAHLVVRLVVEARGRGQRAGDRLTAVTETHHASSRGRGLA